MKASFENSVSVLVRAYFNDTLHAMSNCACAVGNLCANARGVRVIKNANRPMGFSWSEGDPAWNYMTDRSDISVVGYTFEQIKEIEFAFIHHACSLPTVSGDRIFDGLIAVVDVLAEIHGVDLSTKEAAIGQFKEVQLSKA